MNYYRPSITSEIYTGEVLDPSTLLPMLVVVKPIIMHGWLKKNINSSSRLSLSSNGNWKVLILNYHDDIDYHAYIHDKATFYIFNLYLFD